MADQVSRNMESLRRYAEEQGWSILCERSVDHGRQVVVADGIPRVPVNLYNTGRILIQGRSCEMKAALTDWANRTHAGLSKGTVTPSRQNRISRYFVTSNDIERIRDVLLSLPGEAAYKTAGRQRSTG